MSQFFSFHSFHGVWTFSALQNITMAKDMSFDKSIEKMRLKEKNHDH